jgi:hypothetical protein
MSPVVRRAREPVVALPPVAAVGFASVALAPEIRFVLVAIVGVPVCFAAGYALTRVRGISKVL